MPLPDIATARDAVMTHFKTAWDVQTPPVPALRYVDEKQDIPDGDESWARISMQHFDGGQVTVGGEAGNRRFRHAGIVTVQIFTPLGDGLTTSDALVKVAVDAFEGQSTDAGDDVTFRNVRVNEVGPDGAWFQVNVLADFDYDKVK